MTNPTRSSRRKIVLSSSRDIPFDKLVLSQSNVRRIKAGVSIEELADDIARRTLLQSLTVRRVLGADGGETGMFEIPAGGRRFRALELLVKQKRLARSAPVPCIVREDGLAEEDSLAENIQRAPLHPLDQFHAFLALRQKGQSEEEIAAAFFVSVAVVRQRLRLASVSPKLLDLYAEDGLTLDQLMAFTVSGDHERQEQVHERLIHAHAREPWTIRRLLTEGAVRAADKRARFVGLDAYAEAGGTILRDLFQGDDGGWLQDAGLLERMVTERLEREAVSVRAEGWRWIEVAADYPYGHTFGLRRLLGETVALTSDETEARDALQAEVDRIEASSDDALTEESDQRLGEIEAMLAAFEERPVTFEPADIARAGAFVSIGSDGRIRIERGYVRPEDETPAAAETDRDIDTDAGGTPAMPAQVRQDGGGLRSDPLAMAETVPLSEPDEDAGLKPIPDRLMSELTAHRTLALRHALSERPDIAVLAALHVLCLKVFYRFGLDSCLDLDIRSVAFTAQAPGLNDSRLATRLGERHQAWAAALPREPGDLWHALVGFDRDSREALFGYCVSLSVNALVEPYNRRPRALAHADRLAAAVDLDMVAAGWTPTVATYLGRVSKARILDAVREAKGEAAARRIAPLKKGEMAVQAETLLAGSGWLPEPLRTPGHAFATALSSASSELPAGGSTAQEAAPGTLGTGTPAAEAPAYVEHPAIAAE